MNIRYQYHYATGLLKRYGFWGLVSKTLERQKSPMRAYSDCYSRYLPDEDELAWQRENPPDYAPLISIVVPLYETPEQYLRELIESVQMQSYPNWELCLADGSRTENVQKAVEEYQKQDERIRCQRLTKNGGISENTNGGLAMAEGSYIALMDHDDFITPNALYEMVLCLNESYTEAERASALIYSDEDKVNANRSIYSRPHFKPDFNLEFLRHNNYFCHFLMFSEALLEKAGGFRKEYDGAQDYDFVLRCVDAGAKVCHVPKILYHWRIHEGSTAGNSGDKSYAFDNGCRAIEEHLKRRGEAGTVRVTPNLGVYRIDYALKEDYRITVVSENRDALALLRAHYGEGLQYLEVESLYPGIENEWIGDYILYIRKDVSVNPKGLVEALLGILTRQSGGIVSAKLLTKKGRVASCGMIYDGQGNLIPSCGGLFASFKGYFLHAAIPQNVSAVPLACVMIKKEAWLKSGGMETELLGVYRDADFCFRLQKHGFEVVVTPEATAVCEDAEIAREGDRELFFKKWKDKLMQPDPCYNRNLSLKKGHTYAMKKMRGKK